MGCCAHGPMGKEPHGLLYGLLPRNYKGSFKGSHFVKGHYVNGVSLH